MIHAAQCFKIQKQRALCCVSRCFVSQGVSSPRIGRRSFSTGSHCFQTLNTVCQSGSTQCATRSFFASLISRRPCPKLMRRSQSSILQANERLNCTWLLFLSAGDFGTSTRSRKWWFRSSASAASCCDHYGRSNTEL